MWHKLINKVPTTSKEAAYSTPELANEIKQLIKPAGFIKDKILVMAGHKDGLIAIGKDLAQATNKLLDIYSVNH